MLTPGKKKRSLFSLPGIVLLLGMLLPHTVMGKESALVTANNPVEKLSKRELRRLLLGKTKQWRNGDKVVLATLRGGVAHSQFIEAYVGKTAKQFTNYWRKMLFSGKGRMPKAFRSQRELASFVANHKGALGYTSEGLLFNGTKVLIIE